MLSTSMPRPGRLSVAINRIAAEENIPGCWPCTLLRISLRLQWVALLGGWGLGFVTALCVARIWRAL